MKRYLLLMPALLGLKTVFAQTDSIVVRDVTVQTIQIDTPPPPPPPRRVYHLNPAVDIPVTAAGLGWSLYAFSKIYDKDTSTTAQILALNKNNIARINRSSAHRYSPKAFDVSNIFFYGSMPYPLILFADRKIRKDIAKVGFLWLEAMSITGGMYTGAVYVKDKYRPYAYNPEAPMSRRVRGGAKNSFYAGHVALVGTSTFFTAKVYSDYHPESNFKYVLYGVATVATGATAYLRYKAGEHFLTDVLLGLGMGTATGILVPHFHKTKDPRKDRLTIQPYIGSLDKGLAFSYKL